MAVCIRLKFDGATQEQYDTVHGHLGVDESPPEGLIFHGAGPIHEGWGVLDFWESRDAFDRFVEGRLMPALRELGERGMPNPPDVSEFPVHHFTKP